MSKRATATHEFKAHGELTDFCDVSIPLGQRPNWRCCGLPADAPVHQVESEALMDKRVAEKDAEIERLKGNYRAHRKVINDLESQLAAKEQEQHFIHWIYLSNATETMCGIEADGQGCSIVPDLMMHDRYVVNCPRCQAAFAGYKLGRAKERAAKEAEIAEAWKKAAEVVATTSTSKSGEAHLKINSGAYQAGFIDALCVATQQVVRAAAEIARLKGETSDKS